jgi:hypothetical protein
LPGGQVLARNIIQHKKSSCLATDSFVFFRGARILPQRMRLSFVLAVIAAFKLTVSMSAADGPGSQCSPSCSLYDCCTGYECKEVVNSVSTTNGFHLTATHRHGRMGYIISVSNRPRTVSRVSKLSALAFEQCG